jgi:hypothetical protein
MDPGALLYQSLSLLLIMGSLCSLLLAFGVWTARFDWDNPREINSGAPGCLGSLAALAFLALGAGAFVGIPTLAEFLGWPLTLSRALGFSVGLALSAAVGLIPIWLAGQRLDRLGER